MSAFMEAIRTDSGLRTGTETKKIYHGDTEAQSGGHLCLRGGNDKVHHGLHGAGSDLHCLFADCLLVFPHIPDSFYVPFVGLARVINPGPALTLWERNDEAK